LRCTSFCSGNFSDVILVLTGTILGEISREDIRGLAHVRWSNRDDKPSHLSANAEIAIMSIRPIIELPRWASLPSLLKSKESFFDKQAWAISSLLDGFPGPIVDHLFRQGTNK